MAKCDKRIFELLPWYVNGSLSAEEEKEVEAHLTGCAECQKELQEIRALSSAIKEHRDAFASSHVEPEKLVIFAEEPETLDPDEVTAMVKHLQSCRACHEELQTLKRANLELEALQKRERLKFAKEASVWGKVGQRLTWLVREPAFAYIIVVLLAYPAARWLFGPSRPGLPQAPVAVSERVYLLSEQTRLMDEPIKVFRGDKDTELRVGIPFWPDLDSLSYELLINNQSGQTVFSVKDFTDFGKEGLFQLVLNTDSIPDGHYSLIVRSTDKSDPTASSETYFLFQIIKAED